MTMTESKWLVFAEQDVSELRKTKMFFVLTKDKSQCLGKIHWYGPWRQYSFFPNPNTVFEKQCLTDITDFINNLMLDRKVERQKRKE